MPPEKQEMATMTAPSNCANDRLGSEGREMVAYQLVRPGEENEYTKAIVLGGVCLTP